MSSAAAKPSPEKRGPPDASARLGKSVLYISIDGITDPLGGSQILPYLVRLSGLGHRITLLSLEKTAAFARGGSKVREAAEAAGIRWVPLPYRTKPPVLSKIWNARMLGRRAVQLYRETGFDLVHCRSYIPASIGLRLRRQFGVPFLFDMRGFFADERAEGGGWPQTNPVYRSLYRHFKALEGRLFREAAHVISLTEAGKRVLHQMTDGRLDDERVTVIPCCADFSHFAPITPERRREARNALGIRKEAKVIAYLGTIGSWYMLDEMLDFFAAYAARHPDALFLFITPSPADSVRGPAERRGIGAEQLVIRSASREEVPLFLSAADAGLFFIRPVFSKIASSPTKMAELIALGLPIVTNGGVGDVAELVQETRCGVIVERFDAEGYSEAVRRLDELNYQADAVRARALPLFDVDRGVTLYDASYRRIAPAGA